jgi:hypothetical protein
VNGSSELRRSAFASIPVVEVLTNLATREEENAEAIRKLKGSCYCPSPCRSFSNPSNPEAGESRRSSCPREEKNEVLRLIIRSPTERISVLRQ